MATEGSNGHDGAQLEKYLGQIDKQLDELDSLLGSYRESCKGPRSRIANAIALAKKDGLNPVAFKELMAKRQDQRRQKRRLENLDLADVADFESMEEALGEFGDTELGRAAINRAAAENNGASA